MEFGDVILKIAIFSACSYLMNVVLMNFLIAIMGDTFERVMEQREVLALKNKAKLLLQVRASIPYPVRVRFLDFLLLKKEDEADDAPKKRFLFVSEPSKGPAMWSGFFGGIKSQVEKNNQHLDNKL